MLGYGEQAAPCMYFIVLHTGTSRTKCITLPWQLVTSNIVSCPGRTGEKQFTPPTQPWYKATSSIQWDR